jgi:hypothetical protein
MQWQVDGDQRLEEETAPVHTALNPYCGDLSCWCHTDVEYHDHVTTSPLKAAVDDDLFAHALGALGVSA